MLVKNSYKRIPFHKIVKTFSIFEVEKFLEMGPVLVLIFEKVKTPKQNKTGQIGHFVREKHP